MAYRIITIPFDPKLNGFSDEDLNVFCSSKKIIDRKVSESRMAAEGTDKDG